MSDLLTHVLLVYTLLTGLSWHTERIHPRFVAVAMVGTVVPDLVKIELVLSPSIIESLTGLPFSWYPIHRLGGAIVLVAIMALLFDRTERRAVFGYALLGALSQFPLDGLISRANGLSPPYLYPLTWWRPPAGNLYLSSDLWPAVMAIGLAIVIWWIDRRKSVHREAASRDDRVA